MILEKVKTLRIGNLIGLIFTLLMNFIAGSGIIFKNTIGDISDKYDNLFTPAGLTFSIWGFIYLMLFVFILYQLREENKEVVEDLGVLFIILSILNPLWLIVWVIEWILLSLIIMLLLLINLILIYIKLEIGKERVPLEQELIVNASFSLYLGWIAIATIANITIYLVSINWDAMGIDHVSWTIIIILIALVLTSLVLIERKDFVYALVFVWAALGIMIKRGLNNFEISTTALIAIIVVLGEIGIVLIYKYRKRA